MSSSSRTRRLVATLLAALVLGGAPALPAAAEESAPPPPAEPLSDDVPLPPGFPAPPMPGPGAAAQPASEFPSYTVVDLGRGTTSNAAEVNEGGVAAGTLFIGTGEQPVVWRGDATVRLDTGGATQVRALAIGDDGTVGGWQRDPATGTRYAVAWRLDDEGEYGAIERVSEVTGYEGNLNGGEAQSVGADGAVHVTEPRQHVPFGSDLVWRKGAAVELAGTAQNGARLATYDMSAAGIVSGTVGDGRTLMQAAVWPATGGQPTVLPTPLEGASTTSGLAVNDRGDVVVEAVTTYEADDEVGVRDRVVALYADGAYTDLNDLYGDGDASTGDSNLVPWDLSERGDVVGAATVYVDEAPAQVAFLWRDGKAYDLNTLLGAGAGWRLTAAHSINERGQIVGIGTRNGVRSAFLLDPTRPMLFVPGAGASILQSFDDPANPEEIWLGCGTDRMRLSRFQEDGGDQDVRAVDAARYLDCYGLDGRSVDALNAYGGMLDQLTTRYGYREYQVEGQVERRTTEGCDLTQRANAPNLFVFAYDWRQDNRVTARELEDYIGCIQQFYPDVEIDVVAHSMGSLVARRYVMNNREDHGLNEVVTIGAPWLGAPKLVNVLNTGDFIERRLANGDPDAVKHVVSGFPAAHQLMSGPYYHDLAGSVFSEEGWDYDGDGVDREQYGWADLRSAMDTRWSRTAPADTAESFQTQGGSNGQADWSGDPEGDLWTHVYGIQAGQNTIGRIAAVREVSCTPLGMLCLARDHIEQRMTNGDGTVPTTSANRTSGDEDLNAPGADLVPVPVFDTDDNDTVEHTALTRNPRTLQAVMDAIRGTSGRQSSAADKPEDPTADYRYVTARGARDVVLHQGAPGEGPNDAPLEDGTRVLLPGSQHLLQGNDGSLVTMPADVGYAWTVTFTGTGEPMSLESLEGTQESPDVAVRWLDVVVPDGAAGELTLTPTGLERLRLDSDGDGDLDTTVPPTSDLTGEDALDIEAPTVALAATTVDGEERYVVTASDGRNGSGVRRVLWSLDGERFQEYEAPLRAPLAATVVAFAEDWAGNRSSFAELDLQAASRAPVTTLELDPAPAMTGWSAGATTATLTAAAGSGASVAAVRYRTTGAQGIEETTVEGATAEVRVTAPGRTTLWWSAVAEDGTAEPWQQRVLRIDAAPPSVRLRAPAAGAVVESIEQVSGTAADDAAGVRQVEVLLERTEDGRFWDGEEWGTAQTWLPARGTTSWRTTDVPGAADLDEGGYAVRARVTDGAGRVTTSPAATLTKAAEDYLDLVELPLPGGEEGSTSAADVNDSGVVVGTSSTGSEAFIATRWDNGVPTYLPDPAGTDESQAFGVAADGTVAGAAWAFGGQWSAARWNPDGTPQLLSHLPGAGDSMAAAVSTAGAVGWSGDRPALWRPDGTAVALPTPAPGQTGAAADIDESGTIVGTVRDADGVSSAVVWTEGGRRVTELGTLGGAQSAATALNDVGQVIGWAEDGDGRSRAFVADIRDGEGMTAIAMPEAVRRAQVNEIGDDGTVVGEYALSEDGDSSAFVVTAGRFADLAQRLDPLTDWVPNRIYAVNSIGQVVGFGIREGANRGFIASVPHVPVASDVDAATAAGTPVSLRLPATDPDPGTRLTVDVVAGPERGSLSAVTGDEVVYTPARGFDGTDTFTFRASDGRLRSNLATVTVRVAKGADDNQLPVGVITAPASVPEGTTVVLDGSASSDADGSVTGWAWDLDGDGAYDDATGPTAELPLPDEGVRPVALQVTDDDGATSLATSSVEAVNVAPLVSLPATASVNVGEVLRIQGSFSDPGSDTWTATAATGGRTMPLPLDGKAFTVAASWSAPGTYQVRVEVCDGSACGERTTTVTVAAPPVRWPVEGLPSGVTTVQAGQAIPLRFSLGGYRGMDVLADGSPRSQAYRCGTAQPIGAAEPTANPGGSAPLTYAKGADRYQYVWKTDRAWAGSCRTFVLELADGSIRTAEFRFR